MLRASRPRSRPLDLHFVRGVPAGGGSIRIPVNESHTKGRTCEIIFLYPGARAYVVTFGD
jgi:hypothetical protein